MRVRPIFRERRRKGGKREKIGLGVERNRRGWEGENGF